MKKMNNKGFSLVELIIVIAIMAILIAVLAPQYIKYVEKSRRSADLDNYQAIIDAVQTAYSDEDYNTSLTAGGSITMVKGSPVTTTIPNLTPVLQDLGVSLAGIKTKSSAFGDAVLKVDYTGGIVKITVDGTAKNSLANELGIQAAP